MRRLAIALFVILGLPAAAQTPCSTTPVFTVDTSDDPVLLTFQHATSHTLQPPRVRIAGDTIIITQIASDLPPPPTLAAVTCNTQTVSLGTLRPGSYTVQWSYAVPSPLPFGFPQPVETFIFAFAMAAPAPALDGPALIGLMLLLGIVGAVLLRR